MAAHIIVCLLLGLCSVGSGQSLIGASLPCEDPDVNNTMDNLICPFTNETCITTSQICDCVNEAILSGSVSGSGSGSELFSGEYDEVYGIYSLDCSKSPNILQCIRASVNILCRDGTCQTHVIRLQNPFNSARKPQG